MLFIQHNLLAQNANRQLNVNTNKNAKTTEKLSSGYKINRAADDAAGLSISEKMRRQVRGLHQSVDNISEGVGYVQTAEGALNEVQDMLQRINELSVKAANGTNTNEDRMAIDREIQQLKNEMNRIFSETTFNERKIWDYGPGKQEPDVTYRYENAITFPSTNTATTVSVGVTNANCGVLATPVKTDAAGKRLSGGYEFEADDNGVVVKWTGYDGQPYQTQTVTWDYLENNGYSFKMEDYFGEKNASNKLYTYNTATGDYEPVFNKTVSFNVNPDPNNNRTLIKNSINTAVMSSATSVSMSVHDKDCQLIGSTGEVYVSNPTLTYPAAYLSWAKSNGSDGHDFDDADDDFIVPEPSKNLISYPTIANPDNNWVFSFKMEGIGMVTATSTSATIYSSDRSYYETEDENHWWYEWYDKYDKEWRKSTYTPTTTGNLSGIRKYLKNDPTSTQKQGLLSKAEGGWSDRGGSIRLSFSITPDDKTLTYGTGDKLGTVGSFYINVPVYPTDNEDEVLKRISEALNGNTILDFHTTAKTNDSASIGVPMGTSDKIQIPIYPDDYVDEPYDDTQNFYVQAGTESGQHISIKYEYLSIEKLGMADTNALTEESAGKAINEVKRALQIVSEQRSDFGAYQNRLEHAQNINSNVEENTQSAESLIRDTDIADAMMEYSINNILMQAGTSMLTQANQSSQSILELLQ